MFSYKRNLYYTPIMLILKCLIDVSDEFLLHQCMAGYEDDTYMKGWVFQFCGNLSINYLINLS